MADGNLGEADCRRDLGDLALMVGKGIGMHEGDGDGPGAGGVSGSQCLLGLDPVQGRFDGSVGKHALLDFKDGFVNLFGLDDVLGENVGTGLISDPERVAKTLCRDQDGSVALAFEQRIGRNRGSHFDSGDVGCGYLRARPKSHQVANPLYRGVRVGFGIFRQQFVRNDGPLGSAGNHIGERAAAIDPEIPFARRLRDRHRVMSMLGGGVLS